MDVQKEKKRSLAITLPYSQLPVIGGFIVIFSAAITLLLLIVPILGGYSESLGVGPYLMDYWLVSSALAVIAGILAMRRRKWWLAIAGSIISIFDIVGLLGILSIILIFASRHEFT